MGGSWVGRGWVAEAGGSLAARPPLHFLFLVGRKTRRTTTTTTETTTTTTTETTFRARPGPYTTRAGKKKPFNAPHSDL